MLTDFLAAHVLPARTVRETSIRDGDHPVTRRAGEIEVPTLVLAGRDDILCPAWALRSLAETIPGARAIVFDKSAHFPWVGGPREPHPWRPESLAKILRESPRSVKDRLARMEKCGVIGA